jgi:hypothetical protein
VTERARFTARVHGKSYPLVFADMLWSAARHRVGFNDYMEFDFAILTRAERATWVTSPLALELSNRYDDPAQVTASTTSRLQPRLRPFPGPSGSSSSPAMPTSSRPSPSGIPCSSPRSP